MARYDGVLWQNQMPLLLPSGAAAMCIDVGHVGTSSMKTSMVILI